MKPHRLAAILTLIVTILCALIYGVTQQNYRISANDPQIQIAGDVARALEAGAAPADIVPKSTPIDIGTSLGTFIMIFDSSAKTLESSGKLANSLPVPPPGVFDFVRINGENRVTWQPQKGIRIASVVMKYGGSKPGFVLVGRSLREIEIRETNLIVMVVAGWLVSVITIWGGMFWLKHEQN